MTGTLQVEQRGAVRWLLLNRPRQRNALDDTITAALEEQVADADRDHGTRVVVVAGQGPSFCAGGDFRHFLAVGQNGVMPFLARLSACLTRIEASPKPWVAALHGHAIAGGLELALVCDVVIAAEGTVIGDGHLGNRLLPGAGSSVRLERAVGRGVARWMHLSGEAVPAEDLAARGWIREIVPGARLREHAQQIAERLAAPNAAAQQNMKRLLHRVDGMCNGDGTADALAFELDAFERNWIENDAAGALRDFLARRGGAESETS